MRTWPVVETEISITSSFSKGQLRYKVTVWASLLKYLNPKPLPLTFTAKLVCALSTVITAAWLNSNVGKTGILNRRFAAVPLTGDNSTSSSPFRRYHSSRISRLDSGWVLRHTANTSNRSAIRGRQGRPLCSRTTIPDRPTRTAFWKPQNHTGHSDKIPICCWQASMCRRWFRLSIHDLYRAIRWQRLIHIQPYSREKNDWTLIGFAYLHAYVSCMV